MNYYFHSILPDFSSYFYIISKPIPSTSISTKYLIAIKIDPFCLLYSDISTQSQPIIFLLESSSESLYNLSSSHFSSSYRTTTSYCTNLHSTLLTYNSTPRMIYLPIHLSLLSATPSSFIDKVPPSTTSSTSSNLDRYSNLIPPIPITQWLFPENNYINDNLLFWDPIINLQPPSSRIILQTLMVSNSSLVLLLSSLSTIICIWLMLTL